MNIALFGTSADPPTLGHQTILTYLSDRFDRCLVWATDNPFKSHQASLAQRLEMLNLLVESIQPPRTNIELRADIGHPRTYYTVQRARELWQDAALTIVIGTDLLSQLTSWYRAEEFLRQVRILAIPRPGYPPSEADLQTLRGRAIAVETAQELSVPDVSSSAFRNARDRAGIVPAVAAYIHREHLYAWEHISPAIR